MLYIFQKEIKMEVEVKEYSDRTLELFKYGDIMYDNLVLLAPSSDLTSGKLDVDAILEYIDKGKNVFVAVDETISPALREVGAECGVVFEESPRKVVDHFKALSESNDDTLFQTSPASLLQLSSIFSQDTLHSGKLLYEGIAHRTDSISPPKLNLPLLTGSYTSYAPSKDSFFASGKDAVLVSALQARNNARVVFCGSLKMLSDSFFSRTDDEGNKFANQKFVQDLLLWNFQQKSVLRISNLNHHTVGESSPPQTYVIRENIVCRLLPPFFFGNIFSRFIKTYTVTIEEFKDGKWQPYQAEDVQLEWQMLDPYLRLTLQHNNNGVFSRTFQLPDVYGVFTFRLDYERKGYTFIHQRDIIPVRPLRHNEYERFIISAYPYYAGAFSMLGSVVLFSLIFLFSK